MDNLQITEKKMENFVLINIEGSLNSYTYTDFQDKLYALIEQTNVCMDMSKVTNISSAGLGVLMSAMETGEEKGFTLYILNPSDIVKMAIDSTGFGEMFKIINSTDEIK
jgi:anti-anti-sigma factor